MRKNGSLRRRDGRGWKGDCKGEEIIGAGVGGMVGGGGGKGAGGGGMVGGGRGW